MKKLILMPLMLIAGAGVGGGAAFGVSALLGPPPGAQAATHAEKPKVETAFIPTGPITAPIVTADGDLSGYAVFEMQLEVAQEGSEDLAGRMPLVLNAVNLRTFRTPMAAGRGKVLPDLDVMSRLVFTAASEALGKGKVIRAVVTSARPM